MGYGISIGVLIGIIITVFYDRILSPIIDLKYEHYRYKITVGCTEEKLNADKLMAEFVRKYPEYNQNQEETNSNLIGFHMDSIEDKEYEDEDDE
jgi:hypothetical protein